MIQTLRAFLAAFWRGREMRAAITAHNAAVDAYQRRHLEIDPLGIAASQYVRIEKPRWRWL
jgi:hypothetical protein